MSAHALAQELRESLGADRVLDHRLELHIYGKDSGFTRGEPGVVAFPESTADVVTAVKAAKRHGVAVVARGSGTGLAGGAVPLEPALILALTRMNQIEHVSREDRTAWVGPGVINLDLSNDTHPLGLHFAPDPSSQAACSIGGNIANNSGGLHCLSEGTTVNHILAIEVVTPDGDVVQLGGAAPDPIGLDLRGVMVGSEGTLGVVTRALVKLTPDPRAARTLLLAFASIHDAAATVSGIIGVGLIPGALEMMDRPMTAAVERFVHAGFPTDAEAVLLAEVTGHESAVDAEAEVIRRVAEENNAMEVRIAVDDDERQRLWLGRKSAFGAIAQLSPDYYLHDTVVPRTRLVEALERITEIGRRYGIALFNVFHAGDGNLHPLMSFDASEEGIIDKVHAAGKELVQVCVDVGGSLSGEHGIGLEKRDYMGMVFNEYDLDAQARIREAFDPDGLMNPHKVLPSGSRCFDFGRPIPEGTWV
jgi:glycolate oxidase